MAGMWLCHDEQERAGLGLWRPCALITSKQGMWPELQKQGSQNLLEHFEGLWYL